MSKPISPSEALKKNIRANYIRNQSPDKIKGNTIVASKKSLSKNKTKSKKSGTKKSASKSSKSKCSMKSSNYIELEITVPVNGSKNGSKKTYPSLPEMIPCSKSKSKKKSKAKESKSKDSKSKKRKSKSKKQKSKSK